MVADSFSFLGVVNIVTNVIGKTALSMAMRGPRDPITLPN